MSTLRAAVVQLQCQDDVVQNLAECRRQVLRARGLGAQLALLPENFAYMGAEVDKCQHAETLGSGPIQDTLAALAREAELTLIAGGFPERSADDRRPFNTALVFGPDGSLRAQYRKIHLFDVALADGTVLSESSATSSGTDAVITEVAGARIGLSICYDLRFPELYRKLVDQGAQVLVVPAAFTLQTGKDHWHPLLRARAIESQCWLLAAGQWGRHPKGRLTYGHSLIVDPWGVVVAECSDGVGVAVADLDFDLLARVRAAVPCLEHRRLK
ncbi:MAG TPA: carbon-nitrogen hydrolase family protein [Polyangiaceae bacterium]|nr:carbon-nitrogen hydrolase family protein [Polyangiaceae bacterium]